MHGKHVSTGKKAAPWAQNERRQKATELVTPAPVNVAVGRELGFERHCQAEVGRK